MFGNGFLLSIQVGIRNTYLSVEFVDLLSKLHSLRPHDHTIEVFLVLMLHIIARVYVVIDKHWIENDHVGAGTCPGIIREFVVGPV